MSATSPPAGPIDLPHLHRALRAVSPAVLLLPPRILRRVIKRDRSLGGLGLSVPHRQCYIIGRETLLQLATAEELGIEPGLDLAAELFLLEQPEPVSMADVPAGRVLRDAWRLLFHTQLHHEIARRLQVGGHSLDLLGKRIRRLGPARFEEIHEVLRQEDYLFEGEGAAAVWEEFTTVFLELYFFDPHRLAQYFPSIADPERVYRLLTEDLDAAELFRRTRPEGAEAPDAEAKEAERAATAPPAPASPDQTPTEPGVLRLQAEAVARKGNLVRAAIYRLRAIDRLPVSQRTVLRAEARHDVEHLVGRLQKALQFAPAEQADWVRCLLALAEPAARGIWSPSSRLLYDLQKVCIDVERPAFAADLVEWVVSWFQRPIKRPLPDLPLVLAVKHLRQARARLTVVPLPADLRHRLDELTAAGLRAAEQHLRQMLRPKLFTGFDRVGLTPANCAERFARDKLVEELLDLIIERGYLTLGDLRDALARNELKLPDLAGPVTFVTGDPLIRLNRDLSARLDGIYRRGEVYLRWMQRLSSLFFATPFGRLLTLYVVLPLLGSFFILKGIDALSEEFYKFFGPPLPVDAPPDAEHPGLHTFNLVSFGVLAVFLVPMLHVQRFRHAFLLGLWYIWRVVRGLLYDLPAAVLRLPVIRHVLQSRAYLVFYQYAGKPIAWTVPLGAYLWLWDVAWGPTLGICAAAAVAISLLLNSRFGMLIEETASDWLGQTWRLVHDDILPGAFRWVTWASHWLLERVDKMLYAVDEWLRFREGESTLSFLFKVSFGLLWFAVTYVVRLVVNVFIEPQINPIKHFPVVTVSHKLMLLLVIPLGDTVAAWLDMKVDLARGLVGGFLALIPGMFGFLAWELKENWRLYRANRSPTLVPTVVGSHGERIINLLRPGFHSGTLPKLFARIRRARGSNERKQEVNLHHVEANLQRFVERDLLAIVLGSKAWTVSTNLIVGRIHLSTNRIHVELSSPGIHPDVPTLELIYRSGRLLGGLASPGFLAHLPAGPRLAFDHALAGFFKWCGVELLSEQLAALPSGAEYDLTPDRLTIYLDPGHAARVQYDLDDPHGRVAVPPGSGLPDSAAGWLLSERPVTWNAWVQCWEAEDSEAGEMPTVCFFDRPTGAVPAMANGLPAAVEGPR